MFGMAALRQRPFNTLRSSPLFSAAFLETPGLRPTRTVRDGITAGAVHRLQFERAPLIGLVRMHQHGVDATDRVALPGSLALVLGSVRTMALSRKSTSLISIGSPRRLFQCRCQVHQPSFR
jgi:hypothetical protein